MSGGWCKMFVFRLTSFSLCIGTYVVFKKLQHTCIILLGFAKYLLWTCNLSAFYRVKDFVVTARKSSFHWCRYNFVCQLILYRKKSYFLYVCPVCCRMRNLLFLRISRGMMGSPTLSSFSIRSPSWKNLHGRPCCQTRASLWKSQRAFLLMEAKRGKLLSATLNTFFVVHTM